MSKDMPRYRIAVYIPDQTLPTMIPSMDAFGDIMAGRIEDIREVCYADGCTCFHCGALVGGMGGVEIANNLTAHYRECDKHPLAIENRELRKALYWYTECGEGEDDYKAEVAKKQCLQAEADELRKVLWFYAETKDYDGGYRAIEVLQRFPGNQEKKIVVEGVQPK